MKERKTKAKVSKTENGKTLKRNRQNEQKINSKMVALNPTV